MFNIFCMIVLSMDFTYYNPANQKLNHILVAVLCRRWERSRHGLWVPISLEFLQLCELRQQTRHRHHLNVHFEVTNT